MIVVNSVQEAANQWINDYVELLGEPYRDEATGEWRALANAYGTLAIIALRVTETMTEAPK